MMALLAWRRHLRAGQDAFTSSKDVHTHGTTSPFPTADPRVAVYLTDHLAAALLENRQANSVIFPEVRDQRWWLRGAYVQGKVHIRK